jgi:hypothetical protein
MSAPGSGVISGRNFTAAISIVPSTIVISPTASSEYPSRGDDPARKKENVSAWQVDSDAT